jgi:hypothetical protein
LSARDAEICLDDVDVALLKLDGREKLKSAKKSGFGDQVSAASNQNFEFRCFRFRI